MLTLRKHKISRLEEFSDAVFGFALTLLVITASVPRSYAELTLLLQGIPAFACCFALLVWIWHEHDAFFDRYALQDGVTVALNSALMGPGHWGYATWADRRRQALRARLETIDATQAS